MRGGLRIRTVLAGGAVLLSAAGTVVLAAPGASAGADPQVVTLTTVPQATSATLDGSFHVGSCSQYYFEYGTTTAYGQKAGVSHADCSNAGTVTHFVDFDLTGLASGTTYHYRLVVMQKGNTKLYGRDESFTCGGTTVPVGSVGVIGLAALAGCALFLTQRLRRHRQGA